MATLRRHVWCYVVLSVSGSNSPLSRFPI